MRWQTLCLVFVNESSALEQVIRVWLWISRWWNLLNVHGRDTELRRKSVARRKAIAGQQLIIYSFMQIPRFLIPTHTSASGPEISKITQLPLCPSSVRSICREYTITNPPATCLKPPFTPSAPPWPAYFCLSLAWCLLLIPLWCEVFFSSCSSLCFGFKHALFVLGSRVSNHPPDVWFWTQILRLSLCW